MSVDHYSPSRVCIESLEQRAYFALLTASDVRGLLARAASQAVQGQVIAISDRDGDILDIFNVGTPRDGAMDKAIARARTAAFFQSNQDAFTTRTARFIIQDHFPHPVSNTPGGPLYGVEFSSLDGSDVFDGPAISGDPGGIPLFKGGEAVGGIGVAGDGNDIAVREDLKNLPSIKVDNPTGKSFQGVEEKDFDEAVALAGAVGFMAPKLIRADQILLDGLRLPFIKDKPADDNPTLTFNQIVNQGIASLDGSTPTLRGSSGSPFPDGQFAGVNGKLKNTNPSATNFGVISSNDTLSGSDHLTFKDVNKIITQAVRQSQITRGAIRQPIGVSAQVHIVVVDRDGDVLGVFATNDATNFSYDVAVQKSRTAAFFSDDTHAFSTRAIGFLSQRFFPAGIDGRVGPLFHLQNQLSSPANLTGPLKNGITIFPGGIPLYKNGQRVGAIGISGDGVDQDDLIAYAGTKGFRPDKSIRSDALGDSQTVSFLSSKITDLVNMFSISDDLEQKMRNRLNRGLDDVQLPYVKFPRNPNV